MSAQILDGKILAAKLKEDLRHEISHLGQAPTLVNIIIGEDAGALSYTESQKKTAQSLGIKYDLQILPKTITESELSKRIRALNAESGIHGIILSKPLPSGFNYARLAQDISPQKDVEGLNPFNLGQLFLDSTRIFPCTAASVLEHLRSTRVALGGREAVIIGRSEIVGKPLIFLLLKENLTVTVCHSGTSKANKLEEHLKRADVVVAALGRPQFVTGSMIKPGAIVIDVGINDVKGKITGDVDFESVKERAGFVTPVPGGVGPVTSVILMRNLMELFKAQTKKT